MKKYTLVTLLLCTAFTHTMMRTIIEQEKKENQFYIIPNNIHSLSENFYNTDRLNLFKKYNTVTSFAEWTFASLIANDFIESDYTSTTDTALLSAFISLKAYLTNKQRKLRKKLYNLPLKTIKLEKEKIINTSNLNELNSINIPLNHNLKNPVEYIRFFKNQLTHEEVINQHNKNILIKVKNKKFTKKLLHNVDQNITNLYLNPNITVTTLHTLAKNFIFPLISSQEAAPIFVKTLPINEEYNDLKPQEYIFILDLAKNFLPFIDTDFLKENGLIHKKNVEKIINQQTPFPQDVTNIIMSYIQKEKQLLDLIVKKIGTVPLRENIPLKNIHCLSSLPEISINKINRLKILAINGVAMYSE